MATALERYDVTRTGTQARRQCADIRTWLRDTRSPFTTQFGYTPGLAQGVLFSPPARVHPQETGDIVLIQQFYVAPNRERHAENVECLRRNIENDAIDRIVLLNEREYSPYELGIGASIPGKLIQEVIGHRLTYADAARYARGQNVFVVLSNADIFFDASVANVRRSGLKTGRRVLCQLRYEFEPGKPLDRCMPFGASSGFICQPNSQDTWIWHSGHSVPDELEGAFSLALGTPGCDNAVAHRFGLAGFERLNLPGWVRTYHYHASDMRSHHKRPDLTCEPPHQLIIPSYDHTHPVTLRTKSMDSITGNKLLAQIIEREKAAGRPFLLPRVAGIENDVAALGAELEQNEFLPPDRKRVLRRARSIMKKHAGVRLDTDAAIMNYSRQYMSAMHQSTAYFTWAPWGNVARHYAMSFTFVETNFQKTQLDAGVLDVFDAVWAEPWTHALRGQRILIVSAFSETIRRQIETGARPYPVDLFPECTFVFITPPQTQGANPGRSFEAERQTLVGSVREVLDTFDVALCACGGYGNPLCADIYRMGKSAIYVGGVLQMYFGVLGSRWERERPEIVKAYVNENWVRPSASERPVGYETIEKSCYW